MKDLKLSKLRAVGLVILSGFVSWIIANIGINYDRMELGALAPTVVLPVLIAVACLLFIILDWIFSRFRIWILMVTIVAILFLGIQMRLSY